MKNLSSLLLAATLAVAATPSMAASMHVLNNGDPVAAGFEVGGVADSNRGWTFTVNAANVYLTQLGVNTPNGDANTARSATLWDFSTHTMLAQTSFDAGTGWVFNNIAPVALNQSDEYLVSYHSDIADYYYGNTGVIDASWFPNGMFSYHETRFCNGCSASTMPTLALANYQYGMVDFGYQILVPEGGGNVPEPASVALFGLGALAIAAVRRRRA